MVLALKVILSECQNLFDMQSITELGYTMITMWWQWGITCICPLPFEHRSMPRGTFHVTSYGTTGILDREEHSSTGIPT